MIHLPDWLKAAKDTLTATRQWRLLVKEIHVRVAEELSKQNIKFSDLNPGEQQSLVEQMHARLLREAHDSIYNFETAVSSVVDTEVAAEVRRVSAVVDEASNKEDGGTKKEEEKANTKGGEDGDENTSATRIVEVAASAIIDLLEQLPPEYRALTRLMLGQPFPETFRLRAWALTMRNASARKEYETIFARRRVDTISTMDVQITQECQSFLQKLIGGKNIYTRRRLMMMKSVLSYHHTLLMSRGEGSTTLPNRLYWLMLPIVYIYTGGKTSMPELSPGQEGEFLVQLIEAWEFICRDNDGISALNDGEEMETKGDIGERSVPDWATLIRDGFEEADPILFNHTLLLLQNLDPSTGEQGSKIGEDEEASLLALALGTTVSRCLVDTLSLDCCLFVWDQCVMASFRTVIPRVLVAALVCLREALLTTVEKESFGKVVELQGKSISFSSLQMSMERFALPQTRKALGMKTTSMSIDSKFTSSDSTDATGEILMGDEVLKQVLARMDMISIMSEGDLPNSLSKPKEKGKSLGRRIVGWEGGPTGPMGVQKKPEKKKSGEKEAKKEKKRIEKQRNKDWEADVDEAMSEVYGRKYSKEEMACFGPLERKKYKDGFKELKEKLNGIRTKRKEADSNLKEWEEPWTRVELVEGGGAEEGNKELEVEGKVEVAKEDEEEKKTEAKEEEVTATGAS